MAQRRMFSLKIINSAKFLKMPLDAQNLYFHLSMRADDDGVVEAWSAMRLIGSPEDTIKILAAKGFIKVLNEDLVSFITDWHEHNTIRADRKVDSIYKNLLVEIVPDVPLIEKKERADRPKIVGPTMGQPKDGLGEVRLGQVNSGEEREEPVSLGTPVRRIDREIQEAIKLWNTKENLTTFNSIIMTMQDTAPLATIFSAYGLEAVLSAINNLSNLRDKDNGEVKASNIFNRFILRSLDRWTDEAKPWERYEKNKAILAEDIEEVEF